MNNEEKILAMLEKLTEEVGRHSELLAKQGELLEELDRRSLRSAVMLENEVLPKLQLLYEGHVHLQETLAPKERVEALEDELVSVKSTVKFVVQRLDVLEKAQ